MPLPDAVYVETSVLWRLPVNLEHAEFQNLMKLANEWGIPVSTVNLCISEWAHDKGREIHKRAETLKETISRIGVQLPRMPAVSWNAEMAAMIKEIEETFGSNLESAGVGIVTNADVPQPKLLEMDLKKIRPFEEKGEKGFKDTIILYSVLEDAKLRKIERVLLVAEDAVFSHVDVKKTAATEGIELAISPSLIDTIEHLKSELQEGAKAFFAARAQRAREFLLTEKDRILEYVKNEAAVDQFFFTSGTDLGLVDVREVTSVQFVDIENVLPGFLLDEASDGRVKIDFRVRLRIRVRAQPYSFLRPAPKIRLREGATPEDLDAFSAAIRRRIERAEPEPVTIEKEIERKVFLTASALYREDEYSDLRLEGVGRSSLFAAALKEVAGG